MKNKGGEKMKNISNLLESKLLPFAVKLSSNQYISSLRD